MKAKISTLFLLLAMLLSTCEKGNPDPGGTELTLFYFNDPHAHIDNFSKIKHIIDQERETTAVVVACAGDVFSGSPVVDYCEEKGLPMIDLMNKTGVDVAVLGNHEFDYGQEVLAERMQQSGFPWVCANVDMTGTVIPQPFEYVTLSVDELEITFLGLIETYGKPGSVIPATHPLKIQGIEFEHPESVIADYSGLKEQEEADLYIALTHLGHEGYEWGFGDFQIAEQCPWFDLIIGGHSSFLIDTIINQIPVFQAGRNLEYLGKVELLVRDRGIERIDNELIDLALYQEHDADLEADIEAYNTSMAAVLNEVIGYAAGAHERYQLGCFYTDALRERMGVDITFQNHGGIRSGLDEGDITVGEIYAMDPFNNRAVIYDMTAAGIKDFLAGSGAGFYYSGLQIGQAGSAIELRDMEDRLIPDSTPLRVGINDYIPAVYETWFPADGSFQPYTTAEAIIYYLEHINSQVDYPGCNHYFRYQ